MCKRVSIIGAGVAGLSCGIYLAKNGYDVTVFDSHTEPGGLCTGWTRKGFSFNGCMHWLLGAKPGISFYNMWKEIIDIDSIEFTEHEERVQFYVSSTDKYGSHIFHFYNKIDRLEKYLLDISPEDKDVIKEWMDAVRFANKYQNMLPPVFHDDDSLLRRIKYKVSLSKLLPMLGFMKKWREETNRTFSLRFRNQFLRDSIFNLYDNEMQMSLVIFAQSYSDLSVAQYPIGGSEKFAHILSESLEKEGGKLRLGERIEKIVMENNHAVAVKTDKSQVPADFVVSAADWRWTMISALDGKYITPQQNLLIDAKDDTIYYSYCMLFIGVKMDMRDKPHFVRFPIDKLTSPDGTEYERMEVHIYNYDKTLAKEGCCTLSVYFPTQKGRYWTMLRESDKSKYDDTKKTFTEEIVKRLAVHYGEDFVTSIEVADLTTPATYNRYTGNYLGSSQGWMATKDVIKKLPIETKVKGTDNVYLCGHWTTAGGGIPIALLSARDAARQICKDNGSVLHTR